MSANEAKARETIRTNGANAYFRGQTLESCPYQTNGPYGRKMRRIWIDGYNDARDGYIMRESHAEITSHQ